jgi:hypothetical protein
MWFAANADEWKWRVSNMKTNFGGKSTFPREYASAVEREIGESLERTLTPPWSLKYLTEPLDVRSGNWGINYIPDFLITNSTTGHALAVEVKSSLSLSIANIVKLQHIQSALERQETDLLVVVHGGSPDDPGPNARLGEYGIKAIGVRGAIDAASEIEKQLAT